MTAACSVHRRVPRYCRCANLNRDRPRPRERYGHGRTTSTPKNLPDPMSESSRCCARNGSFRYLTKKSDSCHRYQKMNASCHCPPRSQMNGSYRHHHRWKSDNCRCPRPRNLNRKTSRPSTNRPRSRRSDCSMIHRNKSRRTTNCSKRNWKILPNIRPRTRRKSRPHGRHRRYWDCVEQIRSEEKTG